MRLRTAALAALLSLVAVVVALRHREPDRAVMRRQRATAENVWRLLESQPGFSEGMERGRADLAAGRFTRFDPDADLQPSDPYPASLLP